MIYIPITYIPDGPVTSALKRRVKKQRPRPSLGNLGPLLDENLIAAKKHGHLLYHPDDLRLLKGVEQNPEIVDEGFAVLQAVMSDKDIVMPQAWNRTAPYYLDTPRILKRTILLAIAMTIGITISVLLGQDDAIAAMTMAIVAISVLGAGLFMLILSHTIVRVGL